MVRSNLKITRYFKIACTLPATGKCHYGRLVLRQYQPLPFILQDYALYYYRPNNRCNPFLSLCHLLPRLLLVSIGMPRLLYAGDERINMLSEWFHSSSPVPPSVFSLPATFSHSDPFTRGIPSKLPLNLPHPLCAPRINCGIPVILANIMQVLKLLRVHY